ncbi:hypothetical protein [Phytohabitans kaempferiae]|uniref:ADP ribosyltransferase domain-containing protein n=1 Tax=Phytohabitans kaempferiae TaxID=1620943 RepID=A0ABV6MHA6_9ACTN
MRMALPWSSRRRRPPDGAAGPSPGLFRQWYGRVAVMSHTEDPPALLWRLLRDAAVVPCREALVLITSRALADPTCGAALRGVVEYAAKVLAVSRVWVSADGLGHPDDVHAAWLLQLATRTGVELLVPDGPVHVTSDGTRYVAAGTGASGWRSFQSGTGHRIVAHRYPTPSWEPALPDRPVRMPGLVADPIPAGVLLRTNTVASVDRSDPAYDLPVDRRGPTLVLRHVGEPPVEPAYLAALFTKLRTRTLVRIEIGLLDPAWGQPRVQWLDRLVAALDSGQRSVGPEPAKRSRPVGAAPALLRSGWVRAGERLYHHAAERQLLAEVTAAGVLLRTAGDHRWADLAFIDPADGTLRLDIAASEPLVAALCRAVAAAPAGLNLDLDLDHQATARLAAVLDNRQIAAFAVETTDLGYAGQVAAAAGQPAAGRELPTVPLPPRVSSPAVLAPPVTAADTHTVAPAQATSATATAAAAAAADTTVVAAATATAAAPAPPAPRVAAPATPVDMEPAATSRRDKPAVQPLLVHPPVITSSGPPEIEPSSHDSADDALPSTVDESPPAAITLPPTSVGEPALAEGSSVVATDRYAQAFGSPAPDRDSTPQEQRHFTAGLGPAYTHSITTVNAALAAWPALRHDTSVRAKTDLVAVRVYFGRSELGAAHLNARLRAGQQPDLAGYLPCLVSGLRRLPPCRRAMLCQGRLEVPARQLYSEGATLVEPGFRSVSGAGLAAEGADVDYLVWSRTARQAGALAERQELDEAVFLAGSRFKVLAVRDGSPSAAEGVRIPKTAVLLREVLPGEPDTSGLGAADQTALGRLERVLRRRWSTEPQALTDGGAIDRLAGPPLGFVERDGESALPSGVTS